MNYKPIIVALVATIILSGCLGPSPQPPAPTPAPAGQMIPVPIPGNYFQNSSVTSAKLAGNSTVFNFTSNLTASSVTGTTFQYIGMNATFTVPKASAVSISYMGLTSHSNANTSYIRACVDNFLTTPGVVPVAGGSASWNSTSARWFNSSVAAGTHTVTIEGNSTNAAGVLSYYNNSLMVIAYPN